MYSFIWRSGIWARKLNNRRLLEKGKNEEKKDIHLTQDTLKNMHYLHLPQVNATASLGMH